MRRASRGVRRGRLTACESALCRSLGVPLLLACFGGVTKSRSAHGHHCQRRAGGGVGQSGSVGDTGERTMRETQKAEIRAGRSACAWAGQETADG